MTFYKPDTTDREKAAELIARIDDWSPFRETDSRTDILAAALSEARKSAIEECAPLLQEAYSAGISDGHPLAESWQSEWPAIQERFKALKERTT